MRSNCYSAFGMEAAGKKELVPGNSFFKLSANSDSANLRLAEIYRDLSLEAEKAGNQIVSKTHPDAIIREVPESPLIPKFSIAGFELFRRCEIR